MSETVMVFRLSAGTGRTKMFVSLFQIRRQHIFDPFHECADSARQIAPMCYDEGHGERPTTKIGYDLLISPIAFVRAGGFFENFLYGLQVAQGGTIPVYYNPTNRKSTMVATNDIGTEVATLLTGPAWSGQRVVELGSMVTADEVAELLGEVLNLDVKAFAVPRAGWAEALEQFGIPKGHTGPAEEMFEAVNAGWMDLGVEGTEHVAGTTSARDVFEAAQNAAKAVSPGRGSAPA